MIWNVGSQQRDLKMRSPHLDNTLVQSNLLTYFFSSGKRKEEEEKERQRKRARGGMTYDLLIVVNL